MELASQRALGGKECMLLVYRSYFMPWMRFLRRSAGKSNRVIYLPCKDDQRSSRSQLAGYLYNRNAVQLQRGNLTDNQGPLLRLLRLFPSSYYRIKVKTYCTIDTRAREIPIHGTWVLWFHHFYIPYSLYFRIASIENLKNVGTILAEKVSSPILLIYQEEGAFNVFVVLSE